VVELLSRLREPGARTIRVACTHGLFAAGAPKRLSEQPDRRIHNGESVSALFEQS
jgi:ribose-phosphate pyrophosphokinase